MKEITFCSKVLRFRREGEHYVTLSPYAKLIRVNETGYQMLRFCEEIHTSRELAEKIKEEYGLPEERAEEETGRFLELMLKCGLLEKV